MKKSIAFVLLFTTFSLCTSDRVIDESGIVDQQVVNLVICNDCSESTIDKDSAVVFNLLNALMENQLVLTTKKLYNNLCVAYAGMQTKDETFLKTYRTMQAIVQKNGKNLNALHKAIQKMVGSFAGIHGKLTMFASYEMFLAHNYMCKEVDQDHILFIPNNILSDSARNATREAYAKIGKKRIPLLGVAVNDCCLGLYISELHDFDYTNPVFCQEEDEDCISCGTKSILDAMKSLALKPLLRTKISQDLLDTVLPHMNIYLNGHGAYAKGAVAEESVNEIAGISCDRLNGKASDFEELLKLFDAQYKVRSFAINTCFAGLNFKKMVSDFTNQTFFENLSYPILLASGLFASSDVNVRNLWIKFNIAKEELPLYIYKINDMYFYGPRKSDNGVGKFESFFKHLNHTETYEVKASSTRPAYSYVAYRPEYTQAVDDLLGLFNSQGVSILNNLTLIRLPRTTWMSPVELDKRIKTITPIQALTAQKGIAISPDVSIVLLSTPYVQYPINVEGNVVKNRDLWFVPTIIDTTIGNIVYYCIEEMNCSCDINTLGRMFFNKELLESLEHSFSILLKKVRCGKKEYSNVLLLYQYTPAQLNSMDQEAEGLLSRDDEDKESLSDDSVLSPAIRFAMMLYKDEKEQKIKRFVYKGRAVEGWEESFMAQYDSWVQSTESVARWAISKKQEKIQNLAKSLEAIAKRSPADVQREQEYRSAKAKEENFEMWSKPNYYGKPVSNPVVEK